MKRILLLLAIALLMTVGCRSKSPEKLTMTRGWVGGEYASARRDLVPKEHRGKVYVKQIYAGTPAEQAGLKSGDLILSLDREPVKKLKEFRRRVDAATPGNKMTVEVLRDGKPMDLSLVAGRETFQNWHNFMIGGKFSTDLDIWPDPDISLFGLIQYDRPRDRMELRSAEETLVHQGRAPGSGGTYSEEGWNFWFLIFGADAHKQILSQEALADSSQPGGGM